ncbi:MAG: hypothetical protein LBT97_03325 [Planctomycetota bacterium]|jgi:hypothetical protein|nr:hypothetical protein [Planctomycetota bacterium]
MSKVDLVWEYAWSRVVSEVWEMKMRRNDAVHVQCSNGDPAYADVWNAVADSLEKISDEIEHELREGAEWRI